MFHKWLSFIIGSQKHYLRIGWGTKNPLNNFSPVSWVRVQTYRSSNAIGPQIKMHIFYTTAKTKFRKRFFLIFHHLYVIIKHVNMSLDVFLSALSIRNMNIYITPSHEAENAQKSLLYSKFWPMSQKLCQK